MNRTVIVDIQGGLGNQMFCYALARAINSERTYIDTHAYGKSHESREYGLCNYNISLHEANSFVLTLKAIKRRLIKLFNLDVEYPYLEKEEFVFDSVVVNGDKENVRGYWQNLKYFDHIKYQLIQEFTLRNIELNENIQNIIKQVKNENSVAIHIRRGDYVSDPACTNRFC